MRLRFVAQVAHSRDLQSTPCLCRFRAPFSRPARPRAGLRRSSLPYDTRCGCGKGEGVTYAHSSALQKVNEQASVINSYEAGKAVPSNQVLGKLERQLGVKLRYVQLADVLAATHCASGKDIGKPLAA